MVNKTIINQHRKDDNCRKDERPNDRFSGCG